MVIICEPGRHRIDRCLDRLGSVWQGNRQGPPWLVRLVRVVSVVYCAQRGDGCRHREMRLEPAPPVQAAQAEPLFNPLSPEFIRDPYPYYHRLRTTDPVYRSPLGFFVASRHADVKFVLREKCFGKDFVGRMTRRYGAQVLDEPVYRSMRHWMLQQDPPDHTRLRGLVVKAFTARRVEDMRPRIQQIVDATLDRVAPQGHMDLIADFAFRLPVTVICDMLGIPRGGPRHVLRERAHRRPAARSGPAHSRRDRRGQRQNRGKWPSISATCSNCAGASPATISPRSWCRPRRRAASSPTRS